MSPRKKPPVPPPLDFSDLDIGPNPFGEDDVSFEELASEAMRAEQMMMKQLEALFQPLLHRK
ncbi:hypothetical protein Pan44_02610 [Caulifigura coniformis]|uniref:Uncharacterized protein n=1 Tax=Caulifigura coniformis TaxID=2527983 RepID=A0A517S816_9PLAN|nr:hypothetical protein Pan44_02610 [Caulifigura coniformis]